MSTPKIETPVRLPRLWLKVFDVHIFRRRFLESLQEGPPKGFLAGQGAYNRAIWTRRNKKMPESFGSFNLCDFPKVAYENSFWRNFRRIELEGKDRSAWHRHLPLELRSQRELKYVSAQLGETKVLEATMLLWPYGWSSNLSIEFDGSFTREEVAGIVEEVRSGDTFRVGDMKKNLGQTFGYLAKQVEEAIGRTDHVQSVARFLIPILVWDSVAEAYAAQANGWIKEWAYSTVLSRNSEQGKAQIGVYLKGPDFAATLEGRGTLISLACRSSNGLKQVECAVNNMRLFLTTAHVLLTFHKWGRSEAGRSPELDELVRTAERLLRGLPEYYKNPLCQQVLRRLPLAKFFQTGKGEAEESGDK